MLAPYRAVARKVGPRSLDTAARTGEEIRIL